LFVSIAAPVLLVLAVSVVLNMTMLFRTGPPNLPPTYDLAAVKASLAEECRHPVRVEAALCAQVKIDRLVGEEGTLWVPTNLIPKRLDLRRNGRLQEICDQFARARFGAYTTVIVSGERLGNRGCEVDPEGWRRTAQRPDQ
jgi:hypothetical protein